MTKEQLLNLFKHLFSEERSGVVVTLSEIHEEFAYRNKAGAIDKENLENLINALIQEDRVEVLSETEFKIGSGKRKNSRYKISDLVLQESQDHYYGRDNGFIHSLK